MAAPGDLHSVLCQLGEEAGVGGAAIDRLCDLLSRLYGGERLLVPKINRERRDAAVLDAWMSGCQPPEISRSLEVPLRTVYRVIGRRMQRHRRQISEGI